MALPRPAGCEPRAVVVHFGAEQGAKLVAARPRADDDVRAAHRLGRRMVLRD